MESWGSMISQIIWIIFLISAFQPVLQRKLLDTARVRLIRELERQRGSRVISMIHRQESMALFGFPILRYINIEDSEAVLRAIRLTPPEMPIDFLIHTPGGLVLASEQIALALRGHRAKVTVFVPHYAMSGGTLVALAADEIIMDPNAVLGPVDPQLGEYPAASILQVVQRKDVNEIDDRTLILADVAEKAQRQVRSLLEKILADKMAPEQASELAEILSDGRWTHDYPITVDEARMLRLPIQTELPREIYDLMGLYPQPGQRRPSVEYIPIPYGPSQPQLPEKGSRPNRT
jgi:ClpP class serine protease